MKTKQTDRYPEIDWDYSGVMYYMNDHEVHFAADGESKDGRMWTGTAIEIDGEFVEIVDIEKA